MKGCGRVKLLVDTVMCYTNLAKWIILLGFVLLICTYLNFPLNASIHGEEKMHFVFLV